MEDHLGVGLRPEVVAESNELLSELLEVVDLAVVGDPPPPGWIVHGHVPRVRQVDDAQPYRAEAYVLVQDHTHVVRTTVPLRATHVANEVADRVVSVGNGRGNEPGYSAHVLSIMGRPFAIVCWRLPIHSTQRSPIRMFEILNR